MVSTRESLLAALKYPDNASAQRQFVEAYRPIIVGGLRKRRLPDADDIAQKVLQRILRRISSPEWQYDPDRSFRGYVRACVGNAFKDVMRAGKRCPDRAVGGSSNRDRMEQVSGHASSCGVEEEQLPEDLGAEELASRIDRDLWREAEQRVRGRVEPQTWHLYKQWKLRKLKKEAPPGNKLAERLGISVDAVYQAGSRVRRMVRQELTELLSRASQARE